MKSLIKIKEELIKENGLYPINKNLKDYFEFKKENEFKKDFKKLQQDYFRKNDFIYCSNLYNKIFIDDDFKKAKCLSWIFKGDKYFFYIYFKEN